MYSDFQCRFLYRFTSKLHQFKLGFSIKKILSYLQRDYRDGNSEIFATDPEFTFLRVPFSENKLIY